jgi:uncharacterized protein (TIGR03118 family)
MRLLSLVLAASSVVFAGPVGFVQTNLASDATDAHLVNAWGLNATGGSPWWIGANGSGLALIYTGTGVKNMMLEVAIPGDGTVTGVTVNGNTAVGGDFNRDLFLFASEDGTVSGWRSALGSNAETLQTGAPPNNYKGLTYGTNGGLGYLYLANFGTGKIDVLKGMSTNPNLTGSFTDPNLPANYSPFNVQNIGGTIYVAYALKSGDEEAHGSGLGFVDAFSTDGALIDRVASGPELNAPWGLAIAPDGFGDLGGDLLVGNFGDGMIHAYRNGTMVETLTDASGNPLSIDGLWALRFGNNGGAGPSSTLFFTAGPDEEAGGLFGQLVPAPEPATWLLGAAGILALAFVRRRK